MPSVTLLLNKLFSAPDFGPHFLLGAAFNDVLIGFFAAVVIKGVGTGMLFKHEIDPLFPGVHEGPVVGSMVLEATSTIRRFG